MKNILCYCNVYSQLINSIQLKNTIFKDCNVFCVLSDHSAGAEDVFISLTKNKIFKGTFYVKTKDFDDNSSLIKKIRAFLYLLGVKPLFLTGFCFDVCFDEFLYYRPDYGTYCIFNLISRRNKNIQVSRIDEGILSLKELEKEDYLPLKKKTAYYMRKIMGLPNSSDCTKILYSNFADVYSGWLKPVYYPKVRTDSNTVKDLTEIFHISKAMLKYNYKYIFFTSVYDFEGEKSIGEFELIKKISEIVGKENILVKTHPRDTRGIYAANGFFVDPNSKIPWEVIQLSCNLKNVIYLTVNSGAVLSSSVLSTEKNKTFFLFNLCDYSDNSRCRTTVDSIKRVLSNSEMKETFNNVKVVNNLKDFV